MVGDKVSQRGQCFSIALLSLIIVISIQQQFTFITTIVMYGCIVVISEK